MIVSIKLQTSTSFRAIEKIIVILNMYINFSIKSPTHSTILAWVKKIGLYELTRPKERANDWIIILDEVVEFGKHKLMNIYGIRAREINYTRPVSFQDVRPLKEISKDKWSGEIVSKVLDELQQEIGTIKYAIADNGNAIKKGLKLSKIPHVYDLTHKFAWILEQMYERDTEFIEYTKHLARIRGSMCLSKISHIVPPKQRVTARFMNLKPISDWGKSVIKYLRKTEQEEIKTLESEALKWVKGYENFIKELCEITEVINGIEKILKYNGLTDQTINQSRELLKSMTIENKRTKLFKEAIETYYLETTEMLPNEDKILCTSDVIESAFGKYKNYLSKNQMIGITDLSLCLSAFTSNLSEMDIKNAMELIQVMGIKKWTEKNIGRSLLEERKNIFSNKNGVQKSFE